MLLVLRAPSTSVLEVLTLSMKATPVMELFFKWQETPIVTRDNAIAHYTVEYLFVIELG